MAAKLTHEALSNHRNSRFTVCLEADQSFDLEMVHLSELKLSPKQERFSFILLGPADKFLGQGIRHLRHDALGEHELFLVPVGQDESGISYEVVFNRMVNQDGAKS